MSKGYVNNIIMFDTVTVVTIGRYHTSLCFLSLFFAFFVIFIFSRLFGRIHWEDHLMRLTEAVRVISYIFNEK